MSSANQILAVSSAIIATLLIVSLLKKEKPEGLKIFLFWGMVIPIIVATLYLAAAAVIKNQSSISKGPVHWHADYEIFTCGEKTTASGEVLGTTKALTHEDQALDLKDPEGLSNRIGTSEFHEHGDNRIHVEGVVKKLEDVRLAKFFEVIGGQLTSTYLRLPTNRGEIILQNGTPCPDGKNGTLQVFVYKTKGGAVTQEKLLDFPNYVISPYSAIPPGDCIVFEFTQEIKRQTEKICTFYEIAIKKGELKYGN